MNKAEFYFLTINILMNVIRLLIRVKLTVYSRWSSRQRTSLRWVQTPQFSTFTKCFIINLTFSSPSRRSGWHHRHNWRWDVKNHTLFIGCGSSSGVRENVQCPGQTGDIPVTFSPSCSSSTQSRTPTREGSSTWDGHRSIVFPGIIFTGHYDLNMSDYNRYFQ